MKKIGKKTLSILLSLLMIVSVLPMGMITAYAFQPRFTAPSKTGYYADYTRNNCTWYAKCRINEIVGANIVSNMNATALYNTLVNKGYSHGSTAKAGAVAFGSSGHVCIVEKVEGSQMWVSEGHYSYPYTSNASSNAYISPGNSYRNPSGIDATVRQCPGNSVQYGSAGGKYGFGTWFTVRKQATSSYSKYVYLDGKGTNQSGTTSGGTINQTTPQSQNNHYNASAKYDIGTYKSVYKQGVNIRPTPNTNNKPIGLVPYNWDIYVWQTDGNWGYGQFAGVQGWVCLDYFTKQEVPEATTPSINISGNGHIAVKERVTISWASNNASKYELNMSGVETKTYSNLTSNSQEIILNNTGTYYFKVKAFNSVGKETSWSTTLSCVSERDRHVKFVDWDGTKLEEFDVKYGHNAPTPKSPSRKGYSFEGWDSSYFNITSDRTIKATYKIITYTVNFFDRNGNYIGEPQKVDYGHDATPPTDVNTEENYVFQGWNSTAYKNVYTDRADRCINIDGIYAWDNYDLPVRCKNVTAERDFFGYTITVDVENNDSKPTNGRIVVALKTTEGKLVEMTESSAFAIKAGKTKTGCEVYVSCQRPAANVEVYMVTNYSSGIPISPKVSTAITEGMMYTESTVKPNESEVTDLQEVTQYRYRDKDFKTVNSKTLDGYTFIKRNENLASQTGWIDNTVGTYDNDTGKRVLVDTRTVATYATRTKYEYYHYRNYNKGSNHVLCPVDHGGASYHSFQTYTPLACNGNSTCNGSARYGNAACPHGCADKAANNMCWWQKSWQESYQNGTKKQYNYSTYNYTYSFYRWNPWNDWGDNAVTATADRDVETRKIFRYKSNVPQTEDTTGISRTQSGKIDTKFAGKQLMLYVFGYTGVSDYTNQFIGQTTVASDGSYNFKYKLRQEPTAKTGDYTIAIGIEGTSDITIVGTIEAPKPTYTVNFYDFDGNIIDTQTVQEGENAETPESPEKTGYKFLGWDKSTTRIMENLDFYPQFEKEEFSVVFVSWENKFLEVKKFKYGDILVAPEVEDVEGYNFVGWDNESQIVTQDLVVTAQYEAQKFKIQFCNQNNKVISTQEVEYGESAIAEGDITDDSISFDGWINTEDYQEVTHDAKIYPAYHFEESTPEPEINYTSGEYTSNLSVKLTSTDEDAVIYYYLDDDKLDEQEYTGPITINKSCSITYYASSLGKNDSEAHTAYYCINTSSNDKCHLVYYDYDGAFIVKDGSSLTGSMFENREGYNFDSVYSDVDLTNEFPLSTKITSTTQLYTSYVPKKYSVIFNIEGGSILETQSVNYTEAAKDPTVPEKQGYLFAGWDKDYSCVTENMVVTGKYLKESEFAKISLDESSYDLYVNTSFALNPTITPFNLVGEKIEWTSSDTSVASVDENGVVKGLAAGEAVITAKVISSQSTASCVVTIKASAKKAILLNSDSKLNFDSLGYLRRIKPTTSSVTVAKEFVNTNLKFYDIDDVELTETDYVGTGCKIQLVAGENVIDSKTVVVTGDMTGDGIINNKDVAMMNKYLVDKVIASESQGLAIDVNGDGYINNRDAAMLARYLVGKEVIN